MLQQQRAGAERGKRGDGHERTTQDTKSRNVVRLWPSAVLGCKVGPLAPVPDDADRPRGHTPRRPPLDGGGDPFLQPRHIHQSLVACLSLPLHTTATALLDTTRKSLATSPHAASRHRAQQPRPHGRCPACRCLTSLHWSWLPNGLSPAQSRFVPERTSAEKNNTLRADCMRSSFKD